MVTLAACQYKIDCIETWDAYADHLSALCGDAAARGGEILVLPEYAALVLTGQLPAAIRTERDAAFSALQPLLPRWVELCGEIARNLGVYLVPGSAPVRDADGCYRNRAWLFGPDGLVGTQDKLMMTRGEREVWRVDRGHGVQVFDTPHGRLGILICYDNEFPMLARAMTERGVDLILAPSCTDTEAGYFRVRVGAQARALENQIAVLVSPTVGTAPWSMLDENVGRAALYVPPDYGMPPSGVLAESEALVPAESSWLIARIDLSDVRRLRSEGQVATHRDWHEQFEVVAS